MKSAAPDRRVRLIRAIHAEARRIGMADDARAQLQLATVGARSCSDMTVAQLSRVMDAVRAAGGPPPAPVGSARAMRGRALAIARRIGRGEAWLGGIARRQWDKPLDDLTATEMRAVVAAAHRQARREGIDVG